MKKVLFSFCFLLVLLVGSSLRLEAQPAQKLVNVVVSPDRTDWKYKQKEEVTFTVQVFRNENLLKDVVVDYEVGPEYFPVKKEANVLLKNGKTIEYGTADRVLDHPQDPYTRKLLEAVPKLQRKVRV